jgi:hypothetical protein
MALLPLVDSRLRTMTNGFACIWQSKLLAGNAMDVKQVRIDRSLFGDCFSPKS